jgi:beta-xylosidase
VATASAPGGPYTDQGPLGLDSAGPNDQPIGCGDAAGQGNIDPSPFIDTDGSAYLYVSTDFATANGGSQLQPTISVIPLDGDLLHASGARIPLFSGDPGTWEADNVDVPTVEGPAMTKHNGTYYLMYSGGSWRSSYGMGYAISSSPVSGFVKQPVQLLSETSAVLSPGGGDALVSGPHGGTWLAYHGRDSSYDNPRTLRLDRFWWKPGSPDVPVVDGPSSGPVPTRP